MHPKDTNAPTFPPLSQIKKIFWTDKQTDDKGKFANAPLHAIRPLDLGHKYKFCQMHDTYKQINY